LAQGYTRQAKDFFELAQKRFAIQQQLIGYKEDTDQEAEKHMSIIYRLRTKED
jgi:hypothetical protein